MTSINQKSATSIPHERIESLDDPRLEVFRNLKARNAVRDARLFVAEVATAVEQMLCSGLDDCASSLPVPLLRVVKGAV